MLFFGDADLTLSFRISLLVCTHSNGSVTVHPLGFDGLRTWGLDLEALSEDLELALLDRLERSHPRLLAGMVAPRGRELKQVPCSEVVEVLGVQRELELAMVDVVYEPEAASTRVWIPRLDAWIWMPPGEELSSAVETLVQRSLRREDTHKRLSMRAEGGMQLVDVVLEVEPASLMAFTGDAWDQALLPVPEPKLPPDEKKKQEERERTPTLERLAFELDGAQAFARDDEVQMLLRMLDKPGAVVVVGPPGCGKTAVIHEVARRLEARKGWYCDASRLVAASQQGWRAQTLDIVHELGITEAVWFCGDPLQLLDAGKHVSSEMNVAQLLKPYLSAGQLRVVAECSETAWAKLEARDAGFARLFAPFRLQEPPIETVPAVLHAVAADLPVFVDADGVVATLELARRYGPANARMGTACRFLRRLSAEARARDEAGPLGRSAVIRRFCAESGMPEILVRDEEVLDPEQVRQSLRSRVIGQDDAVERLVELVAVIKSGMSDLGRPLGSFLFVGPTGVGKTESAKALAMWLFGASDRLVRFDMSEFSGPDCLARLLDPGAGLVAKVRAQPFCVVLLDEIEKAHPAVFDLLLQLLGEARLSDAAGNDADFRNAVVLMTSNLGVGTFKRPTGFAKDLSTELQTHVLAEVRQFFRPELFNRIDRVVPFQSLTLPNIQAIAVREVESVARRSGLVGRGIVLDTDPAVLRWLAEQGNDPQYGARPLKRAVNERLVGPLARHLSGSAPPRIRVAVVKNQLVFKNLEGGQRGPNLTSLRALLVHCSELRFLAGVWGGCATVVRARREVTLAEQMMRSKRFWRDREAAEARSKAVEPLRDALLTLDATRAEVLALEELAHEYWLAHDVSALEALDEQAVEVEGRLERDVLMLGALRAPRRDHGTLQFRCDEESQPFARELIEAYCLLAIDRGWRIRGPGIDHDGGPSRSLISKVRQLAFPKNKPPTFIFDGPHVHGLLMDESGLHDRRTDSTPQRCELRFDRLADPPKQVLRQYDPRKSQLRDQVWRCTTTLGANTGKALLSILRLNLCCRLLGAELGKRTWKGMRWS